MHTRTIHPVRVTADGMAGIGRTLHDLRGIRYEDGEGGNTPPAPPADPPAAPPAPPAPPASPASTPAWDGKIESLHPDAQKIIADLRKEAGDNRVKAKAESDRVEAILKAAGIKNEEPDPAALLAQSQAAAAQSARELAIYKASANIANPLALLDSTSFLASVSGIDPADGPAITAAIKAAVDANPNLKAARAAGASSVETPGGTGEQGQITEAQLAQMTPEQISDAFDKGLLKNLL